MLDRVLVRGSSARTIPLSPRPFNPGPPTARARTVDHGHDRLRSPGKPWFVVREQERLGKSVADPPSSKRKQANPYRDRQDSRTDDDDPIPKPVLHLTPLTAAWIHLRANHSQRVRASLFTTPPRCGAVRGRHPSRRVRERSRGRGWLPSGGGGGGTRSGRPRGLPRAPVPRSTWPRRSHLRQTSTARPQPVRAWRPR